MQPRLVLSLLVLVCVISIAGVSVRLARCGVLTPYGLQSGAVNGRGCAAGGRAGRDGGR